MGNLSKLRMLPGTPAATLMLCVLAFLPCQAPAQEGITEKPVPTIAEFTEGMLAFKGFTDFFWDEKSGKVWLEISRLDEEFLYVHSLPRGVGSNDIGLDRGQLGDTKVVCFHRIGPKVLLVQPNYSYRADGADAAAKRAVEQSFATSVIWGFETAAAEEGRCLVDATDFVLRDAHGVARSLQRSNQGSYMLDAGRSAVFLPMTKSFPRNSEIEVILTFTGEPEEWLIASVAPSADSVTVHQHHSFVALPDAGYKPRLYDPRSAFGSISYLDYATPFDEPLEKRFITRHRLRKVNPSAETAEVVEPIIYYVDPGIPEPIRAAVMEGAGWWSEAFEAAGFKDCFRVKELPAEADPMDVRYNLIQWVHRSSRGWSYGGGVRDPRTGEIIKGHVTLGSLRIRQDYLIAVALTSPYKGEGDEAAAARELALARIRQLSAHEVGHSIGLMHNYASSVNGRSSVMDYPHPLVKLDADGKIDLSDAYREGIGEWDKVTIAYGYSEFPAGADESAELNAILKGAMDSGLLYLSDAEARPASSAHPYAHLWDNGEDAVAELERVLAVRRAALDDFGETAIRPGEPFSSLEALLVPLYYFHRYQVEAASKILGGLDYSYAVRGDGQAVTQMIDPGWQRSALDALLETLSPKVLALPERIIRLLPPAAPGGPEYSERFDKRTGRTFDPLTAAEAAAGLTVSQLLHPERASRLVELSARDHDQPRLEEVIGGLLARTWMSEHGSGFDAEVARVVDIVVLRGLMSLAISDRANAQAAAIALFNVKELGEWLREQLDGVESARMKAHYFAALTKIEAFMKDPSEFEADELPSLPPGAPIGTLEGVLQE